MRRVSERQKQLNALAAAWDSRGLADIAATKGGISKQERVALQVVQKRKTQAKKLKKGKRPTDRFEESY